MEKREYHAREVFKYAVIIGVVSFFLSGYYLESTSRDWNECLMPLEECAYEYNRSVYYYGFYCDCDNAKINFERMLHELNTTDEKVL